MKFRKRTIRELFKEGYTNTELSIMFEVSILRVVGITRHMQRPERI